MMYTEVCAASCKSVMNGRSHRCSEQIALYDETCMPCGSEDCAQNASMRKMRGATQQVHELTCCVM